MVLAILNLTGQPQEIKLKGSGYEGVYKNWMEGSDIELSGKDDLKLGAWEYLVLVGK